jgi:hypothetical protein
MFFNIDLPPSFPAGSPGAIQVQPAPIEYAASELKMVFP